MIKNNLKMLWEAIVFSLKFCMRNDKPNTIGRIITASLATLIQLVTVLVVGALITSVQISVSSGSVTGIFPKDVWNLLIWLAVAFLLELVIGRFTWFCRNMWNRRLRFANDAEINGHKATLDYGRFRSSEFDELKRRIEELPSGWQTRIQFADELLTFVSVAVSFLLFGASLMWHSPIYAVVIFLVALPMATWELIFANLWWQYFQEMVPLKRRRSVLEAAYRGPIAFMQGILFGQMPVLGKMIDQNTDEVISRALKLYRKSIYAEFILHLIAKVGLLCVLGHLLFEALGGRVGLGAFTIIFASARTFLGNLEGIVALIGSQWISARGVNLIETEFFKLTPLIKRENPKPLLVDGPPKIVFKDVNFAYPGKPDQLVLKGINLTVHRGEKIALVGKSGGGKTSIVALAAMIYDPTSGEILINGQNSKEINPADWHQHIGVFSQKTVIHDRTMGEEIASSRLGDPIDPSMLESATRRARFHSVIEGDPDGWDAQLGTEYGGRDLSGGEEHRLSLSRVYYREAKCLILDEPDSRLDPKTAEKVMRGIETIEDTTLILVTHRVDRAKFCDRIIVVDGGEIVEDGTHDELLTKGGHYAGLLKKLPQNDPAEEE